MCEGCLSDAWRAGDEGMSSGKESGEEKINGFIRTKNGGEELLAKSLKGHEIIGGAEIRSKVLPLGQPHEL